MKQNKVKKWPEHQIQAQKIAKFDPWKPQTSRLRSKKLKSYYNKFMQAQFRSMMALMSVGLFVWSVSFSKKWNSALSK